MAEFLTASTTSLSGVSAGVYTVGAVIIAVAAAGYIIAKIKGVMR